MMRGEIEEMLSVVIITCNRIETLKKTIISCCEHVHMKWELVVVDNGSDDGTEVQVKKICQDKKIDLQYYYSEVNLGVAGARNIGYKIAKGKVLYFIDDDAIIDMQGYCLDEAYNYLINKDDVQILSTKIWDELWNGILPEITPKKCEMTNGVELRSFIGCSHFIKKNEFMPDVLYPDNLFYGGEEAYLSYYIYQHGGRVEYFEGVSVEHHPSKKTRASKFDIYKNRVLNWYIVKEYYYPQPYITVSTMVYWGRILKLTKGNIKKLIEVHELHKKRYDEKYRNLFSCKQMRKLNQKFGFRYLV
mgnify:CR=1 FL=1